MDRLKLADINPHPRDKYITFTEEGHKYTIIDSDGNQNVSPKMDFDFSNLKMGIVALFQI